MGTADSCARPAGSSLSGHILTPLGDGGSGFFRDARLSWDAQGQIEGLSEGEGSEHLIIPGLVDAHVHLPQYRARGQFKGALLPWLREHIWPEEARFGETDYAAAVTAEFRAALLCAGTTSALVYGAPDAASAARVLDELSPLCIKGGDVLMDRNSPAALLRSSEAALDAANDAVGRWGQRYFLTPRFAPTCSSELMAGCGELLGRTAAGLQTHLAENLDEVAWVREVHPAHRSYAATYDAFGLLGPRTVLGHCIHLDDEDLKLLAARRSWVAHCPTSNVALGSGRMPLERIRAAGIPVALATDVGAGPDLSMLDVLRSCLEIHCGFIELSPGEVLAMGTLGSASAMGEGSRRGTLLSGRSADAVALRIPGGLGRGEDGESALLRLLQEFEGRYEEAVVAVWIGGDPVVIS
jgi:guanine deaminase